MARKTKKRRKKRSSTPPVPTGYDASWDLSDSWEAFEKKAEEWDRRDWVSWLREHLAFPFEVIRQEDMDDERYLFGGEPPPEHFAIGSQMTVLGISGAAFEPDFHGVLVDVQQGRHRSVVPLQDLEVRPKDNPNFWPVREFVVWYANR
jgi:hypothetical protein